MPEILIKTINFSGETANILFTPQGSSNVFNLGNVLLPYLFNSSLLNPPQDVYGTYTILTFSADCPNVLVVPRPTPTQTPTNTQTPTQTPTQTMTQTPTRTLDPCKVPSPTPTNTQTPTNTPTYTPTQTPTKSSNPCITPTKTPYSTNTQTPTNTPTPTVTPTNTPIPELPKIYWGKFSGTSITSGDTTLLSSGYTNNPTNTYETLSGSGYGYILIPTGLTQPSEFRNSSTGCSGFIVPFNNIGTIFIVDANGFSINYNVYRTFFPSAGTVDVWLCP